MEKAEPGEPAIDSVRLSPDWAFRGVELHDVSQLGDSVGMCLIIIFVQIYIQLVDMVQLNL